ncbi:hypothetical protein QCE49_19085 [Caballeronia sp. LZ008]|uniref:hypothetical protein n=1 Tax=unclassified Caballeronia TaxID=2646786 RepID=UPI002028C39B|nr:MULTISPECIES: hypothetical protein [unclassified Caballeronia]MDR5795483.1 hypothetical protein [Caballeronia sp. LZ008]
MLKKIIFRSSLVLMPFISVAIHAKELDWLADNELCTASAPDKFYKPNGHADLVRLQKEGAIVGQGKAIADGEEVVFAVKPGMTLWGFPVKSVVLLQDAYPAGSSLVVDLAGSIGKVKTSLDQQLVQYKQAGPFASRFHEVSQANVTAYVRSIKYNNGYPDQGLDEKIGTFRVFLSAPRNTDSPRTSVYCAVEQT